MRVLLTVSALIGAALIGYVVCSAQMGVVTVAKANSSIDVSYADVVTILLTVFGVFLAVASIGLAVAGIVGWNSIEGKAISVARQVTTDNLNDEESSLHKIIKAAISDPGSPLHKTLKAEANRIMFAGVEDVDSDRDELPDATSGK